MAARPTVPEQRTVSVWVIIALLAVVSIGLVVAYFAFFRQDYALLYKELRPQAASAIVAELKKERVPYRLKSGGSEILVPAANLDAVRLSVAGADLPVNGLNGFELFDNSDMGLTDFAQKIKFQRALQGELTRTILLMDGVADARVHLSLPEKTLFRGEPATAKASVTLVMRPARDASPAQIDGVQELVASAIPDLKSEDVVILNGRGELISPRPASATQPAGATPSPSGPDERPEIRAAEAKLAELLHQALPDRRLEVHVALAKRTPPAVASTPAAQTTAASLESQQAQAVTSAAPIQAASTQLATIQASAPSTPDAANQPAPIVPPKVSPNRVTISADRTLIASEQELARMTVERSNVVARPIAISFAVLPPTAAPAPAQRPQLPSSQTALVRAPASPAAPSASFPEPKGAAATLPPIIAWLALPYAPLIGGLALALVAAISIGVFLARRAYGERPRLLLEDHTRFAEQLRVGLATQQAEAPHVA